MSKKATNGPLRRDSEVGCYFVDKDGKPIYLTGSHTWANIQECTGGNEADVFDYPAYLDWLVEHNHNFIRGWHWEQTGWDQFSEERCPVRPLPFLRTGPGVALDGLPKFDCTKLNNEYFHRLKDRVASAGARGIYVSVMLFQGWSTEIRRINLAVANPWQGHPFHPSNNVNGIDGDPGGTGRGIHTLASPSVTETQEVYVSKVIDTVNELDNVLYEIGNEHFEDSFEWQEYMVQFIHRYEKSLAHQHPVGMTSGGGGDDSVTNAQLFSSTADWIAPRERNEADAPYCTDPPEPDGSVIILSDTDHLWGLGGDTHWVWKSFCRGLNTALMDPYAPLHGMAAKQWGRWGELCRRDHPLFEPIRLAMGETLRLANRLDLSRMVPMSTVSSTGFCLAIPGEQYVVYSEAGEPVELTIPSGRYYVEWIDPVKGSVGPEKLIELSESTPITPPVDGAFVLYIST